MRYLITRHDGEEDDITSQRFDNYDDAYELLEEIYGDMCCSDADYEDRPYYEIIEVKDWAIMKVDKKLVQPVSILLVFSFLKVNIS